MKKADLSRVVISLVCISMFASSEPAHAGKKRRIVEIQENNSEKLHANETSEKTETLESNKRIRKEEENDHEPLARMEFEDIFPDEILHRILLFIESTDISNTALVNHRWRYSSQDEMFLNSYFAEELAVLAQGDQKQFEKTKNLLFNSAKTLNSKIMYLFLKERWDDERLFTPKVIALYEKAAKGQDPLAMANLGFIYLNVVRVNQDNNKAFQLFEDAVKITENTR